MRWVILALTLSAAPALAECPKPGDQLGQGIWITYDGDWMTHTRQSRRGLTLELTHTDGENDYFIQSEKVIHIVAEGSWRDGAPVRSETRKYVLADGEEFPEATPGMRWEGALVMTEADGKTTKAKSVVNAADEMSELTIGDCTYPALQLHLVWEGEGEPGRTTALTLLPDLGVVVLTASGNVGGAYNDFFTATAISRKAP